MNNRGEFLAAPNDIMKRLCPETYSRLHGGWFRKVDNLNQEYTNGYSIIGQFYSDRRRQWLAPGLYVDCSKNGDNKKKVIYHTLIKLNFDGTVELLEQTRNNPSWATDLWDPIEKFLPEFKPDKEILHEEKTYLECRLDEINHKLENLDKNQ
ncbi:hypothetical protein Metev_1219 [Methanohalobium evestigatum Z-7303]|uniref:Uncharacterized protein n=2 Tax=Methanohalobium evestigatum TaxID=2322 RepID=D7E7L9_METEZ|nr:hypothetical protein Metev_1219 [Methanohalobium evestigatum Z-7303]